MNGYIYIIYIYSVFWYDNLDRANGTSKMLQDSKLDLNTAAAMVRSLKRFVETKRECFSEYERQGERNLAQKNTCKRASVDATCG